MSVSAEWRGLQQMGAALEQARAIILEEVIPYCLTYGIQLVEQEAKAICPVRTGFLRASIQVSEGIGTGSFGGQAMECKATAPYAIFVETGTTRMTGRWYMYNAMVTATPSFVYAITSRVAEAFAYLGRA